MNSTARSAWLAILRVGDSVAIDYRRGYSLSKITHVTKGGRLQVAAYPDRTFNNHGVMTGAAKYDAMITIEPVTPEIVASIRCVRNRRFIEGFDWIALNDEQIAEIVARLKGMTNSEKL